MKAIAMHCPQLRRLELSFGDCDTEQFFKSVGPGLEHLRVLCVNKQHSTQCLAYVKKYCPNLHSLAIANNRICLPHNVTDLVVS